MTEPQEPRWLSAEQTAAWLPLIGVTTWLPAALDAQLRRDAGMTHVEYGVLAWLSMSRDRTARMSEIAARANVSLSHLSRIAARLDAQDARSAGRPRHARRADRAGLGQGRRHRSRSRQRGPATGLRPPQL